MKSEIHKEKRNAKLLEKATNQINNHVSSASTSQPNAQASSLRKKTRAPFQIAARRPHTASSVGVLYDSDWNLHVISVYLCEFLWPTVSAGACNRVYKGKSARRL